MILAMVLTLLQAAADNNDFAWSQAAVVRHHSESVARFQARIDGDYLLVRATHQKHWHTYAMDNTARAATALQGKKSLGIEQGISITVISGLELNDDWLQTRPRDLSKPELRWFTYGFDGQAFFACRIKSFKSAPIQLRIRGQACSGESCENIDVIVKVQQSRANDAPSDRPTARLRSLRKGLVPVAKSSPESTQ